MEFSISPGIKKKLRSIAWYQIAGGIAGFIVIVWNVVNNDNFTFIQILTGAFAVGVFGFSIFCGQKILKAEINKALKLSAINQSLQLISFSVFGYAFKYAAGLSVAVGFDYSDNFLFSLHFGVSEFDLNINSPSGLILLEFNLVAVYILWLIGQLKKKIEVELALSNSVLPFGD